MDALPEDSGPPAWDPDEPALLAALVAGLAAQGSDGVTVLRPVGPPDAPTDFRVVADTGMTARLAGVPSLGRTLRELYPPAFADRLVAVNREVLTTGGTVREDVELVADADGRLRPPAVPGAPDEGSSATRVAETVRVPAGGLVVVLWRDVTDVRRAEAARRSSEQRFRALVENAADAVVVTDAGGTVTWSGPAAVRVSGRGADALDGVALPALALPEDRGLVEALLRDVAAEPTGGTAEVHARVLRGPGPEGEVRWLHLLAANWLDEPAVAGLVVHLRDVTAQRAAEDQLHQIALEDPLTGLPNRRWFLGALRDAVARSARDGTSFALAVLDVDDFRVVNDSLGHAAGDLLLVELAARLATQLRPGLALARLGGDEFVVVAEGLPVTASTLRDACGNAHGEATGEDDAGTRLAARVAAAAEGRFRVGSVATRVTVSIGVVTHQPEDPGGDDAPAGLTGGRRAEELLAQADAALHEAKRRGRARAEPFTAELGARVQHRLDLGSQLHQALEQEELELYWQPIVRLADRRTVAAEALLRWNHPRRGVVEAAQFLPLAGEVGLMPALSSWAVDAALGQAARWQAAGDGPDVFINLAAVQLAVAELDRELAGLAAWHGVDPHGVFFELSEEVLGTDVPGLGDRLRRKRERGFAIALDDFGAGNTALTWLRRMPVDVLKLDRSFAVSVDESRTRTVVRAILGLARDLGVRTIAEGVETEEQLAFFTEEGCDDAQGYLLGRPGPVALLGGFAGGFAGGSAGGSAS
ncbi:putative bifunctional diguanylate cyclase/phosphodiesterase [Cellulomonas marina]|uniref:PAS domain S-box-containing protein/diguanylate cyclase (GGDEF) domain-containing protein n=1 Tax=Cellulomonas marina TaxID=988821 RepID=A0A1I0Z0W1_9CELL|nr:GGDEF domain-containing phosphodiesterase [Cellulomonas marina]GIG28165.1 hypothetical protein Cma02nite_07650 [Cellulomonas marina]SFB19265.1 PAS domain S-box-containing protein/diguanylate cyclase (GGDEF) domain-containing protein [Cellulomonas marina]